MRILITGATGFIGAHLTNYLVQQPETAVVLLLREAYSSHHQLLPPLLRPLRPRVTTVYADLRNFQLTSRAIREAEPDVVIHLAAAGATNPFLSPNEAIRHNIQGTINLLRASFEKQPAPIRFITARTPGEHSSMNPYAASKAAVWQFCTMYAQTEQWPIVGAMIFQAYGPGQSYQTLVPAAIRAAVAGQNFPMTAGQQARDWIHVTDVAAGLAAMARTDLPPGTSLDLGSGTAVSVADVVGLIYQLTNNGGDPLFGVLPQRPGEVSQQLANAIQTEAALGWKTTVSLEKGLAQLIHQSRKKSPNY